MKRLKAGKRGEVIKYISRAKAIRKLQLSLKDFRKLCILKGVYPREPPKKLKRNTKTYYHLKDINFLALDPIIDRIRAQGASEAQWADRHFLYVGRFVEKKNLPVLLAGYARYRELAGPAARKLVMAGDGDLREALEKQAGEGVEFTGFLRAEQVSRRLAGALALCLVSTEEQWGLVVNEAAAFGVPAIVSTPVGARDALVRNGVTGFVVEPQSVEGIARAMLALSQSEPAWQRYSDATAARAHMGDVERFADAVEALFDPDSEGATRALDFWDEMATS